jgi:short-subunit dehydrogenase
LSDRTAVIGTVEELAQSSRTISLVDEIFEINFFGNVNIIKAILPAMRERKNGHMIVITGISNINLHPEAMLSLTALGSWPPRNPWTRYVLLIAVGY